MLVDLDIYLPLIFEFHISSLVVHIYLLFLLPPINLSLVALMQQTQRRRLHVTAGSPRSHHGNNDSDGSPRTPFSPLSPMSPLPQQQLLMQGGGGGDSFASPSSSSSLLGGGGGGGGGDGSTHKPFFNPVSFEEGSAGEAALWRLEELRSRRLRCLMAGDVDVAANLTQQMHQAAMDAGR